MVGAGEWQSLENGSRWRMVVVGEWQALENGRRWRTGSIRAASSAAISAGQQVRPESPGTAYHSKMYGALYYDSPLSLLYRTDLAGARLAWC